MESRKCILLLFKAGRVMWWINVTDAAVDEIGENREICVHVYRCMYLMVD